MSKWRAWFLVLLFLGVCVNIFAGPTALQAAQENPVASQPAPLVKFSDRTYFPQTGHYLKTKFRQYWEVTGGLAQYGYPLTEEFTERNPSDGQFYTVQYFERNRFEYHPELAGTPHEIQLGLLGVQFTDGRKFEKSAAFISNRDRWYFPETGHSLSYAFLKYWVTRGGLANYGYPISEEIKENGYTVQYFERARFEYHPENGGTPYEVLLGLLGNWALESRGYTLPQIFSLEVSPDSVVQGRILAVTFNNPEGGTKLEGAFGKESLTFRSLGKGQAKAIAPLSSVAELKPRPLVVNITDKTGVVRRFEADIKVLSGNYPSQTLYVTADVVAPEDVAEREQQRITTVLAKITPEKYWSGLFSWPCFGSITTEFATRRTYTGATSDFSVHDGLDIAAPARTPVRAAARGRVVLSERQQVRGNLIILDHGLGVYTTYFHNEQNMVKVGDMVNKGDIIGLVGTTGLSTGPHLHWEVRLGTTGVDPQEWLNREF